VASETEFHAAAEEAGFRGDGDVAPGDEERAEAEAEEDHRGEIEALAVGADGEDMVVAGESHGPAWEGPEMGGGIPVRRAVGGEE